MLSSLSVRYGFAVSAAIVMLAGCSGGSQSPGIPSATAMQRMRATSWMAPDAKSSDLLYISEQIGDVVVFSYPKGKLVGTLTGLPDPQGECVDKKGDVFVTTFGGGEILEYAHGGTSPIATLTDPGWQPNGCSVDPATGNVAVANIVTTYFSEGSLAIYPKGSTSATYYTPPGYWFSVNAVGYDNAGNVMIAGSDGFEGGQNFETGELPKGSSGIENTTLSNESTFGNPGNVQWDGKYITFADANTGIVYRYTFSGTTGTEVSSTQVSGCCSGQVWYSTINGKVLLEAQNSAEAYAYKYPAGGKVTKTFNVSPANCAILSVKKKK